MNKIYKFQTIKVISKNLYTSEMNGTDEYITPDVKKVYLKFLQL